MSNKVAIECEPCSVCGVASTVFMPQPNYALWFEGELLQHAWPQATADQRELLLSGTHAVCWDKIFSEDLR